ncbi:MAG TPA: ABC transporter permease [Dehalococcoidia bacterium]|nr:ABC transporter permease [Dehalococcoidia bacterium]
MRHLSHIWFIALKDLKLFTRDRMALFFFILFPFLFVVLFNFVLSDVGGEDERLALHLITQEAEGGLSRQIIGALETGNASELEPGAPEIIWDRDYEENLRAVEDGELEGFLAFPENFTDGIYSGGGAALEVVADSGAAYTRAALNGLGGSIATQIGSHWVAADAAITLLIEAGIISPDDTEAMDEVIEGIIAGQDGAAAQEPVIGFEVESVGDVEALNPADFVIPGYLVMFVFFAAALAAEIIVRERQNHTLERLLSSTVRRESIIGGIFLGTLAKGLIQILIFWGVGILVFDIDLGVSPAAVVVLSILMVIMSAAFAIMLAAMVKTQRSAGSLATLCALVLAPLGGCWWPLFVTPEWMQALAKLTPHGWATTGFNKLMLFGAEFGDVVPEMLVLLGFAAAFLLIGLWRFRTAAT